MADKYAVAAGGNWSAAGTWSLADGGAGGAGAPSASENAFFSNQSGNVVVDSAATCLDLDCTKGTGYAGALSGSATLAVSGTFKLNGAMTFSYTGVVTFNATATGKTITMAGKNGPNGGALAQFSFNGAGGGWTLQDTLSFAVNGGGNGIDLINGTLDLNGKTVNCGLFRMSAAGTRTLTCGAATITLQSTSGGSSWDVQNTTNLTINAGSATINMNGPGSFAGGGFTYGTVAWAALQSTGATLAGANTFANLSVANNASKTASLLLSANQIITGTFKYLGNSAVNRFCLCSSVIGTSRTITAAAIDATSNFVDFQDIAGAGAAAPFATGSSIGDCGGNSGITATTPATQTATGTASFTWSTHGWTTRVPLPQDDVIINNAFIAGRTITMDMPRCGKSIDFTGVQNNPTVTNAVGTNGGIFYGSMTLVAGITISAATFHLTARGRSACTFTSAGQSIGQMQVEMPGGALTCQDAFSATSNLFVSAGTFDANNFNVTALAWRNDFIALVCVTKFGSGTWTITGNDTSTGFSAVFRNANNGVNGSVQGTATVKFTDATANAKTIFLNTGFTFLGGFWLSGVGTGVYNFTTSSGNGATVGQFLADANRTLAFVAAKTFTATDWQVGAGCTIGSITAAQHTLAKSGGGRAQVSGATISQSIASPASTFYAANSTNGGSNTNWVFGAYIEAQAGTVAIAGQAAGVRTNRKITAQAGAVAIAGEATLRVVRNPAGHLGTLRPRENSPRRPAQ